MFKKALLFLTLVSSAPSFAVVGNLMKTAPGAKSSMTIRLENALGRKLTETEAASLMQAESQAAAVRNEPEVSLANSRQSKWTALFCVNGGVGLLFAGAQGLACLTENNEAYGVLNIQTFVGLSYGVTLIMVKTYDGNPIIGRFDGLQASYAFLALGGSVGYLTRHHYDPIVGPDDKVFLLGYRNGLEAGVPYGNLQIVRMNGQ